MNKSNITGFLIIGFLITFLLSRNQKNVNVLENKNTNINKNIVSEKKDVNIVNENNIDTNKDFIDKINKKRNLNGYYSSNEEIILENDEIKVYFSKEGACIRKVILKKHKDFRGGNVEILCDSNISNFELKDYCVNTIDLFFDDYSISEKDIEFRFKNESIDISIRYELEDLKKFEVKQYVKTGSTTVRFIFDDILRQQEYSLSDCKMKTTINYLVNKEVKDINGYKSGKKLDVDKCKWVAFKQKFFTTGICFDEDVSCTINISDTTDGVKRCYLNSSLNNTSGTFVVRYFFGSNNINIMKNFAYLFDKNVYLGFAFIAPFNRYVFLPVCNYLSRKLSSIMILFLMVLFLKLLLLPISIKIYITTLKMQLVNKIVSILRLKSGNNPQEFAMQQILLYREFGINPLKMLLYNIVQIPFIIALYNYVPVELSFRNSSFLWCKDLSSYDSICDLGFNIPFYGSHISLSAILLGFTMILYMITNNPQIDESGKRVTGFQIFFLIFMIAISNRFCCALNIYYLFFNFVNFILQVIFGRYINIDDFKRRVDLKIKQIS